MPDTASECVTQCGPEGADSFLEAVRARFILLADSRMSLNHQHEINDRVPNPKQDVQ
jgi:hypothetical protein